MENFTDFGTRVELIRVVGFIIGCAAANDLVYFVTMGRLELMVVPRGGTQNPESTKNGHNPEFLERQINSR